MLLKGKGGCMQEELTGFDPLFMCLYFDFRTRNYLHQLREYPKSSHTKLLVYCIACRSKLDGNGYPDV